MVERYGFEILVTDDTGARRLAGEHNVRVVTTFTLLKMVVRVGLAAPEDVLEYLRVLRPRGAPFIRDVTDLRDGPRSSDRLTFLKKFIHRSP